ncbi:hypothetical protein PAMP_016111 [Pampus punctatissimus]
MAADTDMSKVELMRGIISEKLTVAAQEILAVVERIVAGYEEEASGFRQEIDRQRRQLEVLLQPQVKLERRDEQQLFPVCEAAGGGDLHEEEEQYKYEPRVEDSGSLGLEEQEERAADQEYLAPLDYEMASWSVSPRVRSVRRSASRRRTSEKHIDLRIRILEDSQISVLSVNVFQKYPLQQLQCPLGLQEADFLQLLRSSFPQLAADEPFDVFTTDRGKKLLPLTVKTLTPEEICRSIRSAGHSALYIRLKRMFYCFEAQEEPLVSYEELHPAVDGRLSSPTVEPHRKKHGRRRTGETQGCIRLRICILEDSQISVLSPLGMFKEQRHSFLQTATASVKKMEADFLQLLRSSFPQLAADEPFDVFTTDRGKKLLPLTVKTLTPEEICRSIQSAGHSALYIRLKTQEELQSTDDELQASQRRDAADSHPRYTRSVSPRVQSDRRSSSRRRTSEPQKHVELRIRILGDSRISMLSPNGTFKEAPPLFTVRLKATRINLFQPLEKYPLQQLQCPLGLQEADFLQLLRSSFPQLAADEPFDVFITGRGKKLLPLTVKTLTPEEICRRIRSVGHSVVYIRLKEQEERHLQIKEDSPPTADQSSPNTSSHVQQAEGVETEEAADDYFTRSESAKDFVALADGEDSRETVSAKTKRRAKRKSSKFIELTENSDALLTCKVCSVPRGSTNMLIKHAWSHVDNLQSVCGVCGEHSESAEELRSHLQCHQKTHRCNICRMYFITSNGHRGHMARHRKEQTYECKICRKQFFQEATLKSHSWVHVKDKPYKCDVCEKSFLSNIELKVHVTKHTGEDPYRCSVCNKSVRSFESLSRHMRTHSSHTVAEGTYQCGICEKMFPTKHQQQAHVRYHFRKKPYACNACSKLFHTMSSLAAHMRIHAREKHYDRASVGATV